MDRRRFIPSADALDARVLLSSGRPTTVPVPSQHQRTVRIDHLPFVLHSLQPDRQIPSDLVAELQSDLRSLVGKLQRPDGNTLGAVQLQFRATLSNASLSTEDAAGLRSTFRSALESAQAPPAALDRLVAHMDDLVRVDSTGRDPAQLAANDYALILQTALGVGRPIRTPAKPALALSSDDGRKGDHVTTVAKPQIVGTYDANTTIQLFDETGRRIGEAAVGLNGQYSVAPTTPLSVGRHELTVNAVDANGNFSELSRPLIVTIKAPKTTGQTATTTTTTTTTGGTPSGPIGFL